MKIQKDIVVHARYRLTTEDEAGSPGDEQHGPMVYLHGYGHILDALERTLEGARPGDIRCVTVPPEAGYGERNPRLVFKAPRSNLPEGALEEGMMLSTSERDGDGRRFPLRIVELTGDGAIVDGNHPLAGMTLHFEITVLEVRPATTEEIRRRRLIDVT
jgi:FKBP-type peptidyl-prolyl cis-trans isomerase SlyD